MSELISREWLREISRPDLNRIHHALRMTASHPLTTFDESWELNNLANALWNESVERGDAEDH